MAKAVVAKAMKPFGGIAVVAFVLDLTIEAIYARLKKGWSPEKTATTPASLCHTGSRFRRARVVNISKVSKRSLREGAAEYPLDPDAPKRPKTWGECRFRKLGTANEPCPFVSCVHHLYLDVDPKNGNLKILFPDKDPDELLETCELRVADKRGLRLTEIGRILGITRERVRQIESKGLALAEPGARTAYDLIDHQGEVV